MEGYSMPANNVFIAYPSFPEQIGLTIEESLKIDSAAHLSIQTWKQLDLPGRFIVEGIIEKIDVCDFFVSDITYLNFNVTFEIGYAIGRSKRIVLILNNGLSPQTKDISQLGIYDTLGYYTYENSAQLIQYLAKITDTTPLTLPNYSIDRSAPIYIMDTLYKTDASIRIMSKVKKSRIKFRSYDPKEQPRLSTLEAYRSVKQSIAIIINLLSNRATDYYYNNLRGAFLAGLSYGLERETLILQEGDEPVPIDYRDFVSVYKHPYDVDIYINDLAPKVVEGLQSITGERESRPEGFLPNLDIGATAAENEMSNLGSYYVTTNEFNQALAGSVRLAVGRKGSGKTALFFQVRDNVRENKKNIVLDLKPEGHQLKRFRDMLHILGEAVQEHVASAFWEYVLLLEICNKILQKDRILHTRDHTLFKPYQRLASLYEKDELIEEADFSERMLGLVGRITTEFGDRYSQEQSPYLSVSQVNELIYKHDIPKLREELVNYLEWKESVWVLFDNIDKGWPTRGLTEADTIILRALLDSSRKIERFFHKSEIPFITIIFLRNDVYELLIDESPDRGKESKASLDWTDPDGLREVLRRRLVYNGLPPAIPFLDAWHLICVSHIEGEESSQYLIDRSLMRPRNFLTLVNYCKSNAVNLQQPKITDEDIKKACSMYSADIGNEIGLEIRDVFPEAEDILYYFIGAPANITLKQVREYLNQSPVPSQSHNRLIEILLWFGFLGIRVRKDRETGVEDTFIYDVYYDMKKLKRLGDNFQDEKTEFRIHLAFWPFLGITE
jgi:hypothetical protein